MKLAFYKPSGNKGNTENGNVFDRLICIRTLSPYCHVELVFMDTGFPTKALCFSSSPADGGTRFKQIDLTAPEWVLVDLGTEFEATAFLKAKSYLGQKYDWMGIFGFVLPFGEHDDNDKFCSEVCADVLKDVGLIKCTKPWEVSPGELYKMVT